MSFALRNALKVSSKLAATPVVRSCGRKLGTTEAIPAFPPKQSLGVTKFSLVCAPFIYIGGMISMYGAAFLEDYDIFVPEDDDDD